MSSEQRRDPTSGARVGERMVRVKRKTRKIAAPRSSIADIEKIRSSFWLH